MRLHRVVGAEHPPHQLARERDRDRRRVVGDLARRARAPPASSWSGAMQAADQPASSASWAEKTRPVSTHSDRVAMPTSRGRNQLEHASGTIPRRANTKPESCAVVGREPDVLGQRRGDAHAHGGAR